MAALIVDGHGNVLYKKNAGVEMYPASLTKLMTIYLTFDAIQKGQISFDSKFKVSKKASRMPRSKLHLRQGEYISVREVLLSLIIKSANDSAVVAAENLAGSEAKFAIMMNEQAAKLGMSHTHFSNASGWHHPTQKTTAYDMARLAIALKRDFPQYYPMFAQCSFLYKNSIVRSHNHVLQSLQGACGMKTGYTSKAGWNIVTSATRGNINLIGVIMGGDSYRSRDLKIMQLMNKYFEELKTK
jgi:serine-type D-Ala-D-Ala carboxypeptidase (penicillin-binding protein 5/6)